MKQADVVIGKVYQVKVSGVLKAVRVDEVVVPGMFASKHARTNYRGTVLSTNRKIRFTAGRLRKEIIQGHNSKDYLVGMIEGA